MDPQVPCSNVIGLFCPCGQSACSCRPLSFWSAGTAKGHGVKTGGGTFAQRVGYQTFLVGFDHRKQVALGWGNRIIKGVATWFKSKFTINRFNEWMILLMVQKSGIHQLIWSISHYLQYFIHPRWWLHWTSKVTILTKHLTHHPPGSSTTKPTSQWKGIINTGQPWRMIHIRGYSLKYIFLYKYHYNICIYTDL